MGPVLIHRWMFATSNSVGELCRKDFKAVPRMRLTVAVPCVAGKAVELRFQRVLGFHLVFGILHPDRVA